MHARFPLTKSLFVGRTMKLWLFLLAIGLFQVPTVIGGSTLCKFYYPFSAWSEWTKCSCLEEICEQIRSRRNKHCEYTPKAKLCKTGDIEDSSREGFSATTKTPRPSESTVTTERGKGQDKIWQTQHNTTYVNAVNVKDIVWIVSTIALTGAAVFSCVLSVVIIRKLKSFAEASQTPVETNTVTNDTGSYYIIVGGRQNGSQTFRNETEQ